MRLTEKLVSAEPLDQTTDRGLPTLEQIDLFLSEDMSPGEMAEMFQSMIDQGTVWHFPPKFIWMATQLLRSGLCKRDKVLGGDEGTSQPPSH